ncbi:hypothetical protein KJ855_03845, partial [Patescibacteria group bacterium]|nr:hypothetical protein [Patescibacteria group bacterium]
QKISEYFKDLQLDKNGGQWRECRLSENKFYVRPEDVEFYRKIQVPLPSLCPNERLRRKLAYCTDRIYFNQSAATGEQIVSMYPPRWKYQVYEPDYWFSDKWDPMEYGILLQGEGGETPPVRFWEKFEKLQLAVPRLALYSDASNENSDFTNNSMRLKDCYLVFNSADCVDCYYAYALVNCRDCIGGLLTLNSEWCYECREADNCYECFWCDEVKNCRESYWLTDCRGCSNCFMSQGLRHKQYCWKNEQLSKGEYEKRLNNIDLGSWEEVHKLRMTNDELRIKCVGAIPCGRPTRNHNENSINIERSDYIKNSKNVYQSFYIMDSENIAYSEGFIGYKDTYDCGGGLGGERCYESITTSSDSNYEVKFGLNISNSQNVEYCDTCSNCRDCFGCVGLRNKQYCILNKQYSKEEYELLMDKIKVEMLENGDYGEFFPPEFSIVPYNVSEAFTSGPDKGNLENARCYGYPMMEVADDVTVEMGEALDIGALPDNIKDIDELIVEKVYYDPVAGKKFRYLPQELFWHKKFGLALPRKYPLARIRGAQDYFPLGWWWPVDL